MRMATTTTATTTATAATMRGSGERSAPSSPTVRAGLAVARGAKREFQSEYLGTSPGPHYSHLTKVRVRRPVGRARLTPASFFVTRASERPETTAIHVSGSASTPVEPPRQAAPAGPET